MKLVNIRNDKMVEYNYMFLEPKHITIKEKLFQVISNHLSNTIHGVGRKIVNETS